MYYGIIIHVYLSIHKEIIAWICEDVIHYVSGNRYIHHHTQVCNHHTPVYNDVYNDGTVYEIIPRICEDVIH